MNRREVVVLVGAALGSTSPVRAQQAPARMVRIGVVDVVPAAMNAANLAAFRNGLRELGYTEGHNLVIEYRSGDGEARRFPALLAELVGLNVDVIVTRGTPASLAAKQATRTIPVVITGIGDPFVVVDSLAKPGGNITGVSGMLAELDPKRLDLIQEIAPATSSVAALLNMSSPLGTSQLKELERAVDAKGWRFRLLDVRSRDDIERAFAGLDEGSHALVTTLETLVQTHRARIAELAAVRRLPAIYASREFVDAGGLISYAPSFPDMYRRAAGYVDRILKGAKPDDLPMEQPTKFELVVNLKAAQALGLTIPPSLLARADEVIE